MFCALVSGKPLVRSMFLIWPPEDGASCGTGGCDNSSCTHMRKQTILPYFCTCDHLNALFMLLVHDVTYYLNALFMQSVHGVLYYLNALFMQSVHDLS